MKIILIDIQIDITFFQKYCIFFIFPCNLFERSLVLIGKAILF